MIGYTNLEQSKKLSAILPLESADMHWYKDFDDNKWYVDLYKYSSVSVPKYSYNKIEDRILPCWSTEALMQTLPVSIAPDNDSNQIYLMQSYNYDTMHCVDYIGEVDGDSYLNFGEDTFVDACVKMIVELNEKKLLCMKN